MRFERGIQYMERRTSPTMEKLCKNCGSPFSTNIKKQIHCSKRCRCKFKLAEKFEPGIKLDRNQGCDFGTAAELLVYADLIRKGVLVFRSLDSRSPYDLAVIDSINCWRIEVKKGKRTKNGERVYITKGHTSGSGWISGVSVVAIVVMDGGRDQVYYFKPRGSAYEVTEQYKFWLECEDSRKVRSKVYVQGKTVQKINYRTSLRIKKDYRTGQYSTRELGSKYKVDPSTVVRILNKGRVP